MVFASPVFLLLFLPAILALHALWRNLHWRNGLLLVVSLLFYSWGEAGYILVLIASIFLNFVLGLVVDALEHPRARRVAVALAVIANLGLLGYFKYANFFVDNLNRLIGNLGVEPMFLEPVHLPLGISFFTFHALSYVIDVARRDAKASRSPIDFALYISFFPQAIAGPIVRYHEVMDQLTNRQIGLEGFAAGIRRFIVGLAKKMLIANVVAGVADPIFQLPGAHLTPGLAWLGIVCYTLQIYFDFSGYSDMAIGLARMFGFRFPDNFNYPYVATSITDFWRRWHISLSTWYRDYLYIPLGGNRNGPLWTYANLVIVFLLCGLWHGASWTFLLWGGYHGMFLVLERQGWGRLLQRLWAPLRHGSVILIVMIGWVFFRADDFHLASNFLKAMFGNYRGTGASFNAAMFLNGETILAIASGALFATPIWPWLRSRWSAMQEKLGPQSAVGLFGDVTYQSARLAALGLLFMGSMLQLAGGTHNPFIYFRF